MNGFFEFHFYLFSLLAIASALLFVTRKNPVPAALWLVNVMIALAGLYVMLDAPFVGIIQVLVYAGAIMVVFVFVVMLLNLGRSGISDFRSLGSRVGAGAVGLALLANLLVVQRQKIPRIALARYASDAHDRGRYGEVRGVWPVSHGLPGQLHQTHPG